MVKINLKNKVIPVDFGEFQLEFSKSDENLRRLKEFGDELKQKGELIAQNQSKDETEQVKEILSVAFDGVFGAGSFDKVYDLSGQSTIDTLNYFFEVMVGIEEESVTEKDKERMKRYIGK
ncbi:TPA: hypothetical protein U1D18_000691 [Streptococcus suis]|nr:hypothetical protein [Streptococcus suis]HEM3717001.1 hypothetical protein [Streptococcus suis]